MDGMSKPERRSYLNVNSKRRRRIRRRVWNKTNGICWICGKPTDLDEHNLKVGIGQTDRMTIDHVITRAQGGNDSLENLMPSHELCNQQRGFLHYFRKSGNVVKYNPLYGRVESINQKQEVVWWIDVREVLRLAKSHPDSSMRQHYKEICSVIPGTKYYKDPEEQND